MSAILERFRRHPDRLDAAYSLIQLGLSPRYGLRLLRSRYLKLDIRGTLDLPPGSRLLAGALSNKLGQDPSARGILQISPSGRMRIDGHVRLARTTKTYVGGELSIGNGTYVNPNTTILARHRVEIGAGCAISWNCQLLDDDLHAIGDRPSARAITIGDRVWIGTGVIVVKGVSLGPGCVVAAGSVVTKSFPAGSLIGGNPARLLREDVEWG